MSQPRFRATTERSLDLYRYLSPPIFYVANIDSLWYVRVSQKVSSLFCSCETLLASSCLVIRWYVAPPLSGGNLHQGRSSALVLDQLEYEDPAEGDDRGRGARCYATAVGTKHGTCEHSLTLCPCMVQM